MRLGGFHQSALAMLLGYQSEHNSLKLYSHKSLPQRMHLTNVGQVLPATIPARLVARSKSALSRNPVALAPGQETEQRRSVYAD